MSHIENRLILERPLGQEALSRRAGSCLVLKSCAHTRCGTQYYTEPVDPERDRAIAQGERIISACWPRLIRGTLCQRTQRQYPQEARWEARLHDLAPRSRSTDDRTSRACPRCRGPRGIGFMTRATNRQTIRAWPGDTIYPTASPKTTT